jgi:hypothetical protein
MDEEEFYARKQAQALSKSYKRASKKFNFGKILSALMALIMIIGILFPIIRHIK